MSYRIKKRDLKPYVLQWLSTKLELGLGIGKILYLATSGGEYEANLLDAGVPSSEIFSSLVAAEDDLTANKNDVLCVTPGLYTETATTDWDKDHTHLVGLGGPNAMGRQATSTVGARANCMIYTDTNGVDYTIHLSGDCCQFHNIQLVNGTSGGSAGATNYGALGIAGYGNYFKHVLARGISTAAQIATGACCSVEIMEGSGELLFEDSIIGQNNYGGARTVEMQGHLKVSCAGDPPSPSNVIFDRTLFLSRSETATTHMVMWYNILGSDRLWLFRECVFDNMSANHGVAINGVFGHVAPGVQSTNLRLVRCSASGYARWVHTGENTDGVAGSWIMADMPITGAGGGLVRTPTATTGS